MASRRYRLFVVGAQSVHIRDVTPRDGIQNLPPLPVATRVELITRLVNAGVRDVEVGSFVREDRVPAMANTADVLAGIDRKPEVTYWALVPNVRGAELAADAGADAFSLIASASLVYSEKNTGKDLDASIAEIERICALPETSNKRCDAVISCAFGSPWEGDVAATVVAELVNRIRQAGATEITLADTTGMATPRLVMALVNEVGNDIGFHFHDTRRTAVVNAVAAMSAGIRRFDTAVGAIGGSPFAVDAGGNLGTEDLLHLLEDFGVESGISFDAVMEINQFLSKALGQPLNSAVGERGPRWAPITQPS